MSKLIPQTSKDFIGHPKTFPKALNDLRNAIREHDRVLLYGFPGVGKTTSVHVLARELGYEVVETNASDERKREQLQQILIRCQQVGMFDAKFLFLLDEVDGLQAWVTIEEIIKKSVHPVILTANEEWRIPKKVKDLCTRIQYKQPYEADIVKHIRKLTKDKTADFSGVSRDVRASINTVVYGGEKYHISSDFTIVNAFFKRLEVKDLSPVHVSHLIDNAPNFYRGLSLYNFYRVLELASRTKLSLLTSLPKGKGRGITYPYYLRRLKVFRSAQHEQTT